MAKAKKKSTTTGQLAIIQQRAIRRAEQRAIHQAEQRAIRQALRVEYEVDRYKWLCGNKPMTPKVMPTTFAPVPSTSVKSKPKPKPKGRPSYWDKPARRALDKLYPGWPNSTAGIFTGVITEKVVKALKDEIKQSGRSPPTRGLIGRILGRWATPTPSK
jgi:hypothetical protein